MTALRSSYAVLAQRIFQRNETGREAKQSRAAKLQLDSQPPPHPLLLRWPLFVLGGLVASFMLRAWRGYDLQTTIQNLAVGIYDTSIKYFRYRIWKVCVCVCVCLCVCVFVCVRV